MTVYRFNKETGKVEAKQDEHPAYVVFHGQLPRGPHHGQHRRPSPKAHRNPTHGAGGGPGAFGTSPFLTSTGKALPSPSTFAVGARGGGKNLTLADYTFFQDVVFKQPKPPKPPTLPYAGICSGEVIGYRAWWVVPGAGLQSLAHAYTWKPNERVDGNLEQIVWADLLYHEIIWGGVYAYLKAEDCIRECRALSHCFIYPKNQRPTTPDHPANHAIGLARGTVKLWGEVIEHTKGWRAQYAKLASIDFVWSHRDEVERTMHALDPYYRSLNAPPLAPFPI